MRQDTAGYGRIRQDTAGYGRIQQDTAGYLAHANCTLFSTSRAAFVCKKKTRSFRVFPPEN